MAEKKYERFGLGSVPKDLAREILSKLGTNWVPKHYVTSPRCRVCTAPVRCEIEELLYVGVSYIDTAAWCKHRGYQIITSKDVGKHHKEHMGWMREVEERGVARYISQVRKTEAQQLARISGGDVLQAMIEIFADKFDPETEKIKPEVVVKAIKTQHEITGGTSAEDPFLKIYENVARTKTRVVIEPASVTEGEVVEDAVEDEAQEPS